MKKTLLMTFKRVSHNILRNITANRNRGRTIKKFSKKIGLVYFGAVNQHTDEHQVVRGFTASSTHHDYHYCVGSIDGYDITIVDRDDASSSVDGSIKFNNWLVLSFKLQTHQDVPHVFVNANNHDTHAYSNIFAIYPALGQINFGTFEQYDIEFTSRFKVYSLLTDSIMIERLLPANATRVLGAHFWPYSAELNEGYLYVYCDANNISSSTLDAMFEGGLWLARYIDSRIELI